MRGFSWENILTRENRSEAEVIPFYNKPREKLYFPKRRYK